MTSTTRNTTTPRRDPLTEVVDIDSLRLSFDLIHRGQNYVYWSTVPVPLRPLGIIHHEGLRQVATFLVPALIVALAYLFAAENTMVLAAAAAVAFLVGSALHLWLRRDLQRTLKIDKSIDAGRYEATRVLCLRLGLQPEEITIERVHKMYKDYLVRDAELRKQYHDRLSVEAARGAGRDAHERFTGRNRERRYEESRNSNDYYDPRPYEPAVNINGNAMIPGTGLDISGNPYGVL